MTDTGRFRTERHQHYKDDSWSLCSLAPYKNIMKQSSTIHTLTYVGLYLLQICTVACLPPPHPGRNFWRNACKGGLQGLSRFLYNVQQTALTPLSLCCCLDRCSIVPCWGGRGVSYCCNLQYNLLLRQGVSISDFLRLRFWQSLYGTRSVQCFGSVLVSMRIRIRRIQRIQSKLIGSTTLILYVYVSDSKPCMRKLLPY